MLKIISNFVQTNNTFISVADIEIDEMCLASPMELDGYVATINHESMINISNLLKDDNSSRVTSDTQTYINRNKMYNYISRQVTENFQKYQTMFIKRINNVKNDSHLEQYKKLLRLQSQCGVSSRIEKLRKDNYELLAMLFASEDGLTHIKNKNDNVFSEKFLMGFTYFNISLFIMDDFRDNIKSTISKSPDLVKEFNELYLQIMRRDILNECKSDIFDQLYKHVDGLMGDSVTQIEKMFIALGFKMFSLSKVYLREEFNKLLFVINMESFLSANVKEVEKKILEKQNREIKTQLTKKLKEESDETKQCKIIEDLWNISKHSDVFTNVESFLVGLREDSTCLKPVAILLLSAIGLLDIKNKQFQNWIELIIKEASYLVAMANDLGIYKDLQEGDIKNTILIEARKRSQTKSPSKQDIYDSAKNVLGNNYQEHLTKLKLLLNIDKCEDKSYQSITDVFDALNIVMFVGDQEDQLLNWFNSNIKLVLNKSECDVKTLMRQHKKSVEAIVNNLIRATFIYTQTNETTRYGNHIRRRRSFSSEPTSPLSPSGGI
ncbi:hypothetical protein DID75_04805 [Candidatus Marinamargulisbacteria bacterium SCGC AG-410-N11]|nr:hypothetical protein DID75_04805 [Candidatus Marinamargulisbacteria bacterium SCGC AG-410-N11]